MTGMKQKVNHSQRFITLVDSVLVWVVRCEEEEEE